MNELRRDILNGNKVIICEKRANKPIDLCLENSNFIKNEYSENCPFCRGNEHMTSEETHLIKEDNNWVVKAVMNKFPIIDTDSSSKLYGIHEVIIDNYKHNNNFYEMNEKEFYNLLLMYKNRYVDLKSNKESEYICIFKNYLRGAGASLMHPHSQIVSLSFIPPDLINEYKISDDYYNKMGINMYDNIISNELKENKRVIHNSDNFFIFIPNVSRFMGETIIIFKENKCFEEINDEQLKELAIIFKKYFANLYNVNGDCPFNLYLHVHPVNCYNKKTFNVHIHIVPRKFNLGGFELSTGLYVRGTGEEEIVHRLKFD